MTPLRQSRRFRRIAILLTVLLISATAATAAIPTTASAQAEVDSLSISDTNQTVNSDVTDVTLGGDVAYSHDVPDATSRRIELRAGPSEDSLEVLDFRYEDRPSGEFSGTYQMSGSLTDAGFTAKALDPDVAGESTTEVVVQVDTVVERENGETVRATETETVTLSLEDGTELQRSVGGDLSFGVET